MSTQIAATRASVSAYSAKIGGDPLLVQGAGGNVSWKTVDTLWIKASGTWLADALSSDIFVPVDLQDLQQSIRSGNFAATPTLKSPSSLKPSIETMLHAIMPHSVVVHVHAIEALAHLVRKDCAQTLKSLLGESVRWALVPYHKPGPELATAVQLALSSQPRTDVLFLQNHGVVVGGNTVAEVENLLQEINQRLCTPPETLVPAIGAGAKLLLREIPEYQPIADDAVHRLALNPRIFERLRTQWALYPDHVVFLGPKAHMFESVADFTKNRQMTVDQPELIIVKGEGVFVQRTFNAAKAAQLRCYYEVLARQLSESEINPITDADVASLLNWDAEKYRQSLAK